ncbi:MAG: PEP-CTERM sorting domain-containing protein [Bacteroidetes bacterium]|nr:PEP-CTERM sorting domain-containing protein [Bacteroidota bacterium]
MLNHLKTLVLLQLFFLSSSTGALATPLAPPIANDPIVICDTVPGKEWILATSTEGIKSFTDALDWINRLNDPKNQRFNSYHWSLPFTPDGNDENGWEFYDGEYYSYNVTSSELGHIYYNLWDDIMKNYLNVPNDQTSTSFWMATSSHDKKSTYKRDHFGLKNCWAFDFQYGTQYLDSENFSNHVLAIGTPIPEPSTGLLFLTGLIFLTARTKTTRNNPAHQSKK